MKETFRRYPSIKGRFLDKEKFISEHQELADFLETLPDDVYFEYNKRKHTISYYLDIRLEGIIPKDSCDVLPLIMAQGIQDTEDRIAVFRKAIKLGPNQRTHCSKGLIETGGRV